MKIVGPQKVLHLARLRLKLQLPNHSTRSHQLRNTRTYQTGMLTTSMMTLWSNPNPQVVIKISEREENSTLNRSWTSKTTSPTKAKVVTNGMTNKAMFLSKMKLKMTTNYQRSSCKVKTTQVQPNSALTGLSQKLKLLIKTNGSKTSDWLRTLRS